MQKYELINSQQFSNLIFSLFLLIIFLKMPFSVKKENHAFFPPSFILDRGGTCTDLLHGYITLW